MSDMTLARCPFCGCREQIEASNGHQSHFIFCDGCGAEGPAAENIGEAREKWNTRAKPEHGEG